jgi:glycosyltransferase involved in cell wall biosynthesis
MRPYRVHVVYEHGHDGRPYSSAHIRLLRPLSHPSLLPWIDLSAAPQLCEEPVDLVIVDRLWREDVTGEAAEELLERAGKLGARILHSLDDNLLLAQDVDPDRERAAARRAAVKVFAQGAHRVLVSTQPLAELVRPLNDRVSVIPNHLDERLLPMGTLGTPEAHRQRLNRWRQWPDRPLTVGYMGTLTHDHDLAIVVPALRAVARRHPGRINIEIVGAIQRPETWSLLYGLPYRELKPGYLFTEYPTFLPWFCGRCSWDIGVAPLADLPFNRYKSDVKFLDYAALGAAGIYSRTAAYVGAIQDGVTGWLVDNTPDAWEAALEHAIERPAGTITVGWMAQRYLRQHRMLAVGAEMWLNAIRLTMTQER